MSLVDSLMQSLGGDAISQIAGQLGSDDDKARGVTGAALTAMIGGLAKNADGGGGAQALLGALQRDHDGSALDRVGDLVSGPAPAEGAGILKHVFGGKESGVESAIGQAFGVDKSGVANVMASLAPIVLGALGKQARQGGLDASSLSSMLGQERSNLSSAQPQGMQMLNAVLDSDGDGDVDMSDILKKGSGLLGKLMG